MRRSSLVLALSGMYAAGVSAQSCAPQYTSVADWVEDFQPALSWCSARYGVPTTTVVVTQTIRPQQKRAAPTHFFANIGTHNKPRPDEDDESHLHKRQRFSPSRGQFYYDLMNQQSRSAWVQGVCSCIIHPVTRSVTTRITLTPTARTTTSRTTRVRTTSSQRPPVFPAPEPTTASPSRPSTSIPAPPAPPSANPSPPAGQPPAVPSQPTNAPPAVPPQPSNAPPAVPPQPSNAPPAGPPQPSNAPPAGPPQPPNGPPAVPPRPSAPVNLPPAVPSQPLGAVSSAVAPAVVAPISPVIAASGCVESTVAGTGACQCTYNVLCGWTGSCGSADTTVETAAASWQQCAQQCDNNSDCTAWTYSYADGSCVEITDLDCSSDLFETDEDPDSVLGVYSGADCGGMCLI